MNVVNRIQARAYCNFGRWIADCPAECGSAVELKPGQAVYHCSECSHISVVYWPPNVDEITAELDQRPAPRTRNWFPQGHDLALRSGCPHGQSVAELRDETRYHLGGG